MDEQNPLQRLSKAAPGRLLDWIWTDTTHYLAVRWSDGEISTLGLCRFCNAVGEAPSTRVYWLVAMADLHLAAAHFDGPPQAWIMDGGAPVGDRPWHLVIGKLIKARVLLDERAVA